MVACEWMLVRVGRSRRALKHIIEVYIACHSTDIMLCFDLRSNCPLRTYSHRIAKPPIKIPPIPAPTENKDLASHPSRPAALGELLLEEPEPPALPEPEGDEEVGLDPPAVGEGVKTPPDGSWARHEDAAEAASSAVLGPVCNQRKQVNGTGRRNTHESGSKWRFRQSCNWSRLG